MITLLLFERIYQGVNLSGAATFKINHWKSTDYGRMRHSKNRQTYN